MDTYTNVVLDRSEREIVQRVLNIITIAFPDFHEVRATARGSRNARKTQRTVAEATALVGLAGDPSVGTYELLSDALWAVGMLAERVEQESKLSYWLAIYPRTEESTEPTSAYQRLRVLADIRADQVTNTVMPALELLHEAVRLATPRRTREMELA